ncbi:MAG TPA: DUF4163 domain-containing protein [Rhodothermales bacterium]|nr:DUF4163 domain-containing protein [Rhodothermales bacterium]
MLRIRHLAVQKFPGTAILTVFVSGTLWIGGCQIDRRGGTAGEQADTTAAQTDTVEAADSTSAGLSLDRDSTADRRYYIDYSALAQLPPDVQYAARGWAVERKNHFLRLSQERSEAPDQPHLWELIIDFEVPMDSGAFVSAVGESYSYTGGAHGINQYETFNYDTQTGRQIGLSSLFADTSALRPISAYARTQLEARLLEEPPQDTSSSTKAMREAMERLRAWIRQGTAPIRGNYRLLYLVPAADGKAAGIGIIFSPYQIAPGAAGTQTLFVPTSVFQDQLKPDDRDRFSTAKPVGELHLGGEIRETGEQGR